MKSHSLSRNNGRLLVQEAPAKEQGDAHCHVMLDSHFFEMVNRTQQFIHNRESSGIVNNKWIVKAILVETMST